MADNPHAFPCLDNSGCGLSMCDPGMTLRDWFAGQMLCSLRRHHTGRDEWFAAEAYRQADAMLAARSLSPDRGNGE